MEQANKPLWGGGGRFSCGMNVNLAQLNNSLSIDKRLYAEDICGSLAYAEVLTDAKIIQSDELEQIRNGFGTIKSEWDSGEMKLNVDDEDVHSVNERRLIELIGDIGRKIHTGRSRNDQVAVDMKLWVKKAIIEVLDNVNYLLRILLKKAEDKIHVIMPGYTHLQVRSTTLLSTHLYCHFLFSASSTREIQSLVTFLWFLPPVRQRSIETVTRTC